VSGWKAWVEAELAAVRAANRWRQTVAFDGAGPVGVVGEREVVSFASNDYLGLAGHPSVRAAAIEAIEHWGAGSSASRLVTGTRTLHHELEHHIAQWKETQAALVFPTGYAANLGVLQVLGIAEATIFSDELNHASIIDGCRLAKARKVRFRHNDVEHLSDLMRSESGPKIVVTEAVFSMDGDTAPLDALLSLCARHDALLIVDEAHAVLSAVPTHAQVSYLRVGTLSKTLGALGGWVAGSRPLIELLVNRARTFIYTTGLTPADTAAGLAALSIYRSAEGERLRARLRGFVETLRPGHGSPIVPVILGSEAAAIAASAALFEQGLYVPAIRPPTVPPGTCRLRVALSAAHSGAMIIRLRDALATISSNVPA
jgi:8-amino-7-oxononanoate synthase